MKKSNINYSIKKRIKKITCNYLNSYKYLIIEKLNKIHFKKWKISEKAPNNALDLNIIKNKFIINSILL